MANLSADAPLRFIGQIFTEKFHCDSAGAQTIYKGAPLVIDQNVDTVNVHTADSLTLADGDVFVGIAAEKKVVASGDSETGPDSMVEVIVEPTIVGFKSAVFTDAAMGDAVYMSDTGTLSGSNGTYPRIGKLHRVLDGYAYVRLESPFNIDVP